MPNKPDVTVPEALRRAARAQAAADGHTLEQLVERGIRMALPPEHPESEVGRVIAEAEVQS